MIACDVAVEVRDHERQLHAVLMLDQCAEKASGHREHETAVKATTTTTHQVSPDKTQRDMFSATCSISYNYSSFTWAP